MDYSSSNCYNIRSYNPEYNNNHQAQTKLTGYELSCADTDRHSIDRYCHSSGYRHYLLRLRTHHAVVGEKNKRRRESGRFYKLKYSFQKREPTKPGVELKISWQQV